jgi:ferritin
MKTFQTFKENGITINEAIDLTAVKPISPNKLPAEVVNMLNDRIGDEYTAHYFYRYAANWCKKVNYKKAAAFFEAEANSELEHAKGLQDYLVQWNEMPAIPQAPTRIDFTSLVDIINRAYQLEYDLYDKYCEKAQRILCDIHCATFNFIQGYVDIQSEAVGEYSDLLNALMLINTDSKFEILYFENEYFG